MDIVDKLAGFENYADYDKVNIRLTAADVIIQIRAELESLRAQLASAQAEKAELEKALRQLSHATYEAWTSLSAAESNALKAFAKDNQEVNK